MSEYAFEAGEVVTLKAAITPTIRGPLPRIVITVRAKNHCPAGVEQREYEGRMYIGSGNNVSLFAREIFRECELVKFPEVDDWDDGHWSWHDLKRQLELMMKSYDALRTGKPQATEKSE